MFISVIYHCMADNCRCQVIELDVSVGFSNGFSFPVLQKGFTVFAVINPVTSTAAVWLWAVPRQLYFHCCLTPVLSQLFYWHEIWCRFFNKGPSKTHYNLNRADDLCGLFNSGVYVMISIPLFPVVASFSRTDPPIFFSGTTVTFSSWIISGLYSGWAYKVFSW